MLDILIAIRVWKEHWKTKSIQIHCDNAAVISVLNMGRTREKHLATISRNIFMLCAEYDIHIKISHVMGSKNVVQMGWFKIS